jgi:hypothetical protein
MRSYHWIDGWLHCRYAESRTHLTELHRLQSARYGTFSVTCLLAAAAVGAGILGAFAGQDLLRRDCPDLLAAGDVYLFIYSLFKPVALGVGTVI